MEPISECSLVLSVCRLNSVEMAWSCGLC